MEFIALLDAKNVKPKEKTEAVSEWILNNATLINEFIGFASVSKDPVKATCMEALEFATKAKPEIASKECLEFATKSLSEKAPRIKWESARVIANIVHLYPDQLDIAVKNLLANSSHDGTVVRWSAALALGQIIILKLPCNKELIPIAESIINREEKNSIRKIYLNALKKLK